MCILCSVTALLYSYYQSGVLQMDVFCILESSEHQCCFMRRFIHVVSWPLNSALTVSQKRICFEKDKKKSERERWSISQPIARHFKNKSVDNKKENALRSSKRTSFIIAWRTRTLRSSPIYYYAELTRSCPGALSSNFTSRTTVFTWSLCQFSLIWTCARPRCSPTRTMIDFFIVRGAGGSFCPD